MAKRRLARGHSDKVYFARTANGSAAINNYFSFRGGVRLWLI